MAVLAKDIDVRSLRRIALLVMRAKQDCGPDCRELRDIALLIEHMKRNVAMGVPFAASDVHKMTTLIKRLDGGGEPGCHLRFGIIDELRELVFLPKIA